MPVLPAAAIAIVAAALTAALEPQTDKQPEPKPAQPQTSGVLDLTIKRIDGADQPLSEYAGQVVLIVNVASACGFTPQYAGLQKLYLDKKDKGLVVLGFPSNDFGKQEPGSNKDIAEFCSSKFSITFPMFEKISVKGDSAHELYKRLAAQPAPIGGEPKWNFTKFIVDRTGKVVARFDSKATPDSPDLVGKIDELLAQPKPSAASTPAH